MQAEIIWAEQGGEQLVCELKILKPTIFYNIGIYKKPINVSYSHL